MYALRAFRQYRFLMSHSQLGNFLGALQNWVALQKSAAPDDQVLFSIVGWHSLTLPQNPQTLTVARREMLAALLAIGLDPKRSVIFHQDEVGLLRSQARTRSDVPVEPASYRARMAFELHNATGKAQENDDVRY